jgi:hypothetical protein
MSNEPQRPLPDFSPPSISSAPSINRAAFRVHPTWMATYLLSRTAHVMSWRIIEGGLVAFEVQGDPSDINTPTRCSIYISPLAMVEKLLPPGNAIRECRPAPDDSLEFVFEGIDAPPSSDGHLPLMRLMLQTDAKGGRETYIEKAPAPAAVGPDDDLLAKIRNRLNKHPGKDGAA